MNRILIIQTASLGDVILATSVAETLHLQFPSCRIDFLIKKGYESIFSNHPFLQEILLWDKRQNKYQNLIKLALKIRNSKYDAIIIIQRHFSSGILAALSGAGIRSGFRKNPLSIFFTHKADHLIGAEAPFEHEIIRNHHLIDFFVDTAPAMPAIYPSTDDFVSIEPYKKGKYITIAPASLWFTKQFPAAKWIDFIDQVPSEYTVLLLGAAGDTELCNLIIAATKNKKIDNLAGKLTTLQSAALMKDAAMNFVNDSAPLHLASATNSPVTAVFCSTVPAFGFGPLSDNSMIIESEKKIPCKPCGLHGHQNCPENHFLCADSISSSQLLIRLSKIY